MIGNIIIRHIIRPCVCASVCVYVHAHMLSFVLFFFGGGGGGGGGNM